MNDVKASHKKLVEKILSDIDPEIRATLEDAQIAAIEKALVKNLPEKKKHPVDIHGVLPLLFNRLYFVFSAGKDNRETTMAPEYDDRTKTPAQQMIGFLVMFLFISCILGYFLLTVLELFF